MEKTVYDFAKGQFEAIEIDFTQNHTTWFNYSKENTKIHMLQDCEDVLYLKGHNLITKYNFNYPALIYDITRKNIDNNINKAWKLKESYM